MDVSKASDLVLKPEHRFKIGGKPNEVNLALRRNLSKQGKPPF
jgi:hypothetical protein